MNQVTKVASEFRGSSDEQPWLAELNPEFRMLEENPDADVLVQLVGAGELDRAMRHLYQLCDVRIQQRRFDLLAKLMESLSGHVGRSLEFDIAVLTATLPATKSLSQSREAFGKRLHKALENAGEDPATTLHGLV